MTFYRHYGKRILDVAGAVCLLLLVGPIVLVAAVAVRIRLGSPVFWRQQRPGLGGCPFTLIKLRTMTGATSASGELLPDAERMTRLGSLLRSSSIDELPELLNVLKGDMSLVGPRPLLMRYLQRYSQEQARRHAVRPGISGLAQVNGRNALGWEEKLRLDAHYVDHYTFGLDLRLLVLTVVQVVARRGISAPGQATATEFMGSAPR